MSKWLEIRHPNPHHDYAIGQDLLVVPLIAPQKLHRQYITIIKKNTCLIVNHII